MSAGGPVLGDAVLRSERALDDALARAIRARTPGIALRSPGRVMTTGNGRLPLAGCRVATLRAAAQWPPFEDIAVVLAAHLESGRVFANRAFAPSTEISDPPPMRRDPGEGWSGDSFRIDAAERLGVQIQPGTFALWLMVRGESGGPVYTRVVKPDTPGFDDQAVAKFVADWRGRNIAKPRGADPAAIWPVESVFGSYPSYRIGAESPPVPRQGISLWARRVLALESGARWVLAGSFRLAIPRRHVVLTQVSGNPATAVVPISIVATSSLAAGPVVVHLRVPSKTPINERDAMPVVEGHFTINLFSLPRMWRAPDTYYLYAVCGDTLSAPAVSALVSQEMLAGER